MVLVVDEAGVDVVLLDDVEVVVSPVVEVVVSPVVEVVEEVEVLVLSVEEVVEEVEVELVVSSVEEVVEEVEVLVLSVEEVVEEVEVELVVSSVEEVVEEVEVLVLSVEEVVDEVEVELEVEEVLDVEVLVVATTNGVSAISWAMVVAVSEVLAPVGPMAACGSSALSVSSPFAPPPLLMSYLSIMVGGKAMLPIPVSLKHATSIVLATVVVSEGVDEPVVPPKSLMGVVVSTPEYELIPPEARWLELRLNVYGPGSASAVPATLQNMV